MPTRRLAVLALPLFAWLAATPPAAAARQTPEGLVRALYVVAGDFRQGPAWTDPAFAERFLSPSLRAAFETFAARSAASDEPPALNGDPFFDAQDREISELTVHPAVETGDSAAVRVTFRVFGDPRDLTYTVLFLQDLGWRVDDIAYAHPDGAYTLRALLAEE